MDSGTVHDATMFLKSNPNYYELINVIQDLKNKYSFLKTEIIWLENNFKIDSPDNIEETIIAFTRFLLKSVSSGKEVAELIINYLFNFIALCLVWVQLNSGKFNVKQEIHERIPSGKSFDNITETLKVSFEKGTLISVDKLKFGFRFKGKYIFDKKRDKLPLYPSGKFVALPDSVDVRLKITIEPEFVKEIDGSPLEIDTSCYLKPLSIDANGIEANIEYPRWSRLGGHGTAEPLKVRELTKKKFEDIINLVAWKTCFEVSNRYVKDFYEFDKKPTNYFMVHGNMIAGGLKKLEDITDIIYFSTADDDYYYDALGTVLIPFSAKDIERHGKVLWNLDGKIDADEYSIFATETEDEINKKAKEIIGDVYDLTTMKIIDLHGELYAKPVKYYSAFGH